MAEDEFISKMQMAYFGEKNALDECISVYKALLEENKQLKEDHEKESYLVDKLTRQLNQEQKNTNNAIKKLKQRSKAIEEIRFIINQSKGMDFQIVNDIKNILKKRSR